MSWAKNKSYAFRVKLPISLRESLYSMIKSFIKRRDAILKRISFYHKLPQKANRHQTYLETLLSLDLPQHLKDDLISLIRARDLIVYAIASLPQVKKLVRDYLRTQIGDYDDSHAQVESTVIIALAQGLDRMAPDKIGVRVDFLIVNLQRLVPKLAHRKKELSIEPRKRWTREDPLQEYCFEEHLASLALVNLP